MATLSQNFVGQTTFTVGAQANDEYGVVTLRLSKLFGKPEYQNLINLAYSLQAEVDAALEQSLASDLERQTQLWEQSKQAARQARKEYNTAREAEFRMVSASNNAENEWRKDTNALEAQKRSAPTANDYPTQEQIAAHQHSVEKAQALCDASYAAYTSAMQSLQMYYIDVQRMGEKFNEAARAEYALRLNVYRLQGKDVSEFKSPEGLLTN